MPDRCQDARKYRWPVRVEKPRTDDGLRESSGHVDLSDEDGWETHCEGYAAVMATSGREFALGQQVMADTTHVLAMPATKLTRLIRPQMRVVRKTDGLVVNLTAAYAVGEDEREIAMQGRSEP